MIPTPNTDRKYRTYEALSLASLLVALAVTNLLWGLNVTEYNPLVEGALGATSWTTVAIGGLAITAGAFSLLRWADRQFGIAWFGRLAVVLGAVSLANAANDAWILYQHGVPETFLVWDYIGFLAAAGLAAAGLYARYEIVDGIRQEPAGVSRQQARAIGLVAIMVLSLPAMFAVPLPNSNSNGAVNAQTASDWAQETSFVEDSTNENLFGIAWSKSGRWLAVGQNKEVRIFDREDGYAKVATISNGSGNLVEYIEFADDSLLWSWSGSSTVYKHNVGGAWDYEDKYDTGGVEGLDVYNDQYMAVLDAPNDQVEVVSVDTLSLENSFSLGDISSSATSFYRGIAATEDYIGIGARDSAGDGIGLLVSHGGTGASPATEVDYTSLGANNVEHVDISPDGSEFAFVSEAPDVHRIDTSDGSVLADYTSPSYEPDGIDYGPDGNYLGWVTAGTEGETEVRDLSDDSTVVDETTGLAHQDISFTESGDKLAFLNGKEVFIHNTGIDIPSLDISVVDQGGEPIEGASVEIEPSSDPADNTTTGADGTASFILDSEQSVDVTASTSIDSKSKTVSARIGGRSVKFGLSPGDLQVVDQDGEPVSGATVIASGPTNTSLDASLDDAEALRQEAEELLDEISGENVRPDNWDPSIDIPDEVASGEYTVAHTPDQWQSDRNEFGDLSEPVVRVEQSDVILSNWDTEKESGISISQDPVNKHLPGETTDGDIKVEQLSPSGEVLQTKTLSTYKAGETIPTFSFDTNEHRIVRTYLPKGNFYRISPARGGNGYILAVGNPEDFVSAWVEDVETEAGSLMDRAQRIENLIDNQELWYERRSTGRSGQAVFNEFPSDVEVADVRAFKGPGVEELVEANESGIETPDDVANLTLQDIREMRNESIFEGDIFITERKRIDSFPATIEGEWVSDIPAGGEIPDEEQANETREDIEDTVNETKDEIDEYGEKLKDLIALRDKLINDTQDLDGFMEHFEAEYPEYATDGEFDFPEPETVEEASAQVQALRNALSSYGGTNDGDIDEEVGDITDTFTKVIDIPDRIDSLEFVDTVEIAYEDDPGEEVGEEYLTVEDRGQGNETVDTGWSSTVLVIEDFQPSSSNIDEVSVSFTSPYDDVNSTIGTVTSTLTRDITVPSEVQQLADVRNVTIEYNSSAIEMVPKENQTLFTDNDTLRIDSHPVDSSLTVENVVVEFADFSKEVDNVTFIGDDPGSDQAYLNTTVEVEQAPDAINLTGEYSSGDQTVLTEWQDNDTYDEMRGVSKYGDIGAEHITVSDPDNDDNADLEIEYPIPEFRNTDEFVGLKLNDMAFVNTGDDDIELDRGDAIEENGTTNRYLNTTLSLSNSYASIDDVTPVRIHYTDAATESIEDRYLSFNATSDDLTISNYEVGTKAIQYIEVTGNNSNTEIINDTQDVTELNESLQGRIKLDASPASVNDVEAVAYWQNGDVEEIPNTYLELEPAIGTMEVGSGDPGSYLLVDGYPTLGRELDRIDVSVGETNASVTPIEGGQFLNAEVSFEDGLFSFNDVSEEDVTILAEWQDGETTRIPQQYWDVDGELTGVGKILINDYPVPEDKVAGNIEVIARAGDEIYRVSDRVESPTYGGESADVEYVSVSNLEPATGEVVRVRTGLKDEVENVELTNATIVSPRGNTMDATINNDSTVSFPAGDGPGTYRVDLIFKDTSEAGDIEFERSVPIEATNERRNHPPVVHEMSGGDQSFAFVGALEAGDIETDPVDETTTMTAIIERGADPPSVVHYHPSNDGVGSGETYALKVRQGEDRQTVRSHVSAVVHVPLGDNALVYRQGNKPLTTGGTSFGELDKDNGEIRTYTNDQGEVEVRVIQDPGLVDRAVFSARTFIYDFSLPLGMLRFALLMLLSSLLLSRRRVGEVVQSWT